LRPLIAVLAVAAMMAVVMLNALPAFAGASNFNHVTGGTTTPSGETSFHNNCHGHNAGVAECGIRIPPE
jgi:hypothetical protein